MEWVETTGKTVEEARARALEQLGVAETDAEIDVLEEPRPGLFGRLRGEARVRARVAPRAPRGKTERRDRRRPAKERATTAAPRSQTPEELDMSDESPAQQDETKAAPRPRADVPDRPASPPRPRGDGATRERATQPSAAEQGACAATFVEGLVAAFGLAGVVTSEVDDDRAEVSVAGEQLGVLIGPRGNTLQAVQELTRTVVQRTLPEVDSVVVRLDVAGYRARRRAALEAFAKQVADQVAETGVAHVLEPMHAADRKVIHDTVNELGTVSSTSEGDEPRRRVVILPLSS